MDLNSTNITMINGSCANSSSNSSHCLEGDDFSWYLFFVRECTYPTGLLATAALFFNAGVVATLFRARRHRKSFGTQSVAQLSTLAVIDFCFCAAYFGALLWRICIDAGWTPFDDVIDQIRWAEGMISSERRWKFGNLKFDEMQGPFSKNLSLGVLYITVKPRYSTFQDTG